MTASLRILTIGIVYMTLNTLGCSSGRNLYTSNVTKNEPSSAALIDAPLSLNEPIDFDLTLSEQLMPVVVQRVTYKDEENDSTSADDKSADNKIADNKSADDKKSVDAPADSTNLGMSLSDFESLALANNPTLKQLAATSQKAAGFRTQVALRANPVVGYQGQQLADAGTDQHLAFVEQEIVTGDKLALNRSVLNQAVRAQKFELEAQQYRIATDIRVKFYEALAAQRRIRLISEFETVTSKGVELAEIRKKAMEGSEVEVLQAKIQLNEVELSRQQAEVAFIGAWRELVALTGTEEMPPAQLNGDFLDTMVSIDWNVTKSRLLTESPEYHAAQARVQQACASLARQGVQAIPNLTVQFGAGVDNGTNSGMMNLQVGAPIPVFNKNQGNIAAARAEYCRAIMEVQRIENSIQSRLAVVSRDFDSALLAVKKYSGEILPNAEKTLKLSEEAYKAGEFSFLQVLIVRRTYFDANLQYLTSQTLLAQADAKANGFVLTGGLDATNDQSGDDSLRGLTFSQR